MFRSTLLNLSITHKMKWSLSILIVNESFQPFLDFKMSNQLIRSEDLLLFLPFMMVNEEYLG